MEELGRFPQSKSEFTAFMESALSGFVSHARLLLGNLQDAEDVVQDVILKSFENRSGLRHVNKPRQFVHRMISNSCNDLLRKKTRTERSLLHLGNDSASQGQPPADEGIIRKENDRHLHSLMEKLPGDQSLVIRLRLNGDMSFSEIALFTGSPVTTVKSRFAYGMNKLRSMYLTEGGGK